MNHDLTDDLRNLADLIDALEARLETELAQDRAAEALADIAALMERLEVAGQPALPRLQAMQRRLQDDVTDDGFDNMPV